MHYPFPDTNENGNNDFSRSQTVSANQATVEPSLPDVTWSMFQYLHKVRDRSVRLKGLASFEQRFQA